MAAIAIKYDTLLNFSLLYKILQVFADFLSVFALFENQTLPSNLKNVLLGV